MRLSSIIILILALTTGCSRNDKVDNINYWPPLHAEADSLMTIYENVTRGFIRDKELVTLIAPQLDSIADASGSKQLKARSHYLKHYLHKRQGERQLMIASLDSAMALTDSTAYPYDRARISAAYLLYSTLDPDDRYCDLKRDMAVFKQAGDSFYISNVYSILGGMFEVTSDLESSAAMFDEAIRWLSDSYGFQKFILSYNKMMNLYNSGQSREWVLAVDSIRESEYIGIGDKKIEINTLLLSYEKSKNPDYLRKAFREAQEYNGTNVMLPHCAALLADYHMKWNNLDSMNIYASLLRATMIKGMNHYDRMLLTSAEVYERQGMPDSARAVRSELNQLLAHQAEMDKAIKIQAELRKSHFESIDRELEKEQQRSRLGMWLAVIAGALIAGTAAIILIGRLQRKNETEREALRQSLDRKNRRLTVAELKVAEKEQQISELVADIRELKEHQPTVANKLLSKMNTQQLGDNDWEKIELLFGDLNPNFMPRLKALHPSLTRGELKLAALTYLGLETKDISRVLGITSDSVKKNRQRMRQKMELDVTVNLQDYLRGIDL